EEGLPHPNIISESGRALVAHHAVLVIDVLGTTRRTGTFSVSDPGEDAPMQLRQMWETWACFEEIEPREALHDVVSLREDVNRLFVLGHCTLARRAQAEELYWHMLTLLVDRVDEEQIAELIPAIRTQMADRYFCNFSLFQSLPDAWAIDQVFPVMPIHRLHEEPERQGILVDITCDSDGKMQNFPLASGHSATLPLHAIKADEDYLLGVFLTGAYQEILGDLHNLFGDTHAVHVRMDGDQYELEQIVEGESVAEVLDYVQFNEKVLLDRMRRQLTQARNEMRLTASEATRFLRFYKEGLNGYSYLEENLPPT
ncbi:MAG: arginine decarboxylase, partial [Mariprofundus sp.]